MYSNSIGSCTHRKQILRETHGGKFILLKLFTSNNYNFKYFIIQGTMKLPESSHIVELPDDQKERLALLKELTDLSSKYLKYGIGTAPQQTLHMLQVNLFY